MKNRGFERILLATDGSNQAKAAVGIAASFARASSASVRVVHVWNLEVHHRHGVWDVETRSEAESLLQTAVLRLIGSGADADGVITRADSRHVADAIAEAAREYGADLVVVGSRGLSDWRSMFDHSTSHEVLTRLDCPVLVVRSTDIGSPHVRQRVLLAVAGKDDLEVAARAAAEAAAAPGSEVKVVHVAQSFVGSQGFAYVEPTEEIEATVKQAEAWLRDAGVKHSSLVAEPGRVAETLARIAAGWDADVIVIASSRMGDLASLLFGSVTHDLIRATDRPVLVAERIRP